MEYKDRGIIKWAPFDALVGFQQMIQDVKYKMAKREKPLLLEDQLASMDIVLKDAVAQNKTLEITYYEDGYIKSMYGRVVKIDTYNKCLILEYQIRIAINAIIDLSIID